MGHASRLFFWGPPGALVVRRPEGKIEFKMTYGLDFFIADLPLPFRTGYRLPLYFSIAKVFNTDEEKALKRGVNAGMDMIGFSVTLKR